MSHGRPLIGARSPRSSAAGSPHLVGTNHWQAEAKTGGDATALGQGEVCPRTAGRAADLDQQTSILIKERGNLYPKCLQVALKRPIATPSLVGSIENLGQVHGRDGGMLQLSSSPPRSPNSQARTTEASRTQRTTLRTDHAAKDPRSPAPDRPGGRQAGGQQPPLSCGRPPALGSAEITVWPLASVFEGEAARPMKTAT